jgi:ABC-type branched-subunit amino acid transport system substrate-binding protein
MAAAGVASALCAAACGSSSTPSGLSSSASGGGSCAKTFQIPVVDEYTGAGSFLGAGNLAAVKLAERQINANGGVDGYCLGYKTYDTQTSPPQAALIFRQLAASSALFILGPSQSTDAQAAFPVAKSEGITAITPGVTDGSIIANARPWVFDTNILATVSLPQGGKDFVESTGAKQVMAIVDTQDVASNTQAAVIEAAFKAAGATVKQIDITSNQVSFNSEISQVTSAKPQALFVCANPAPSAAIVNGIVASGLKTALNLCQSVLGTGFVGVVPNQVNDLYVFDGSPYANSLTTPQVTAFKKGIAALTNGQEPGIIAPNMYTAVYLVANALKRSGALTSTASLSQRRALLRDALDQTTNLPVLEGTVSIDPNAGLAKYSTGNGFFLKYEDGNFNVVKP